MRPSAIPSLVRVPALLGAAAALASCAAMATAPAPPLSPDLLDRGRTLGFEAEAVTRGRGVFVDRCAECHSLPAIPAYTPGEWGTILPRMARKARLATADADAVRAFVYSAAQARGDLRPGPAR